MPTILLKQKMMWINVKFYQK